MIWALLYLYSWEIINDRKGKITIVKLIVYIWVDNKLGNIKTPHEVIVLFVTSFSISLLTCLSDSIFSSFCTNQIFKRKTKLWWLTACKYASMQEDCLGERV